jgi:hypothetical protein
MLRLSNSTLPTLANNCYIVGEAKRADVIWSEGDFKALCEHMLNENPLSHLLNVWIDASGRADSQRHRHRPELTDGQAGRGLPSLERRKVGQGLVFIHQTRRPVPLGCA